MSKQFSRLLALVVIVNILMLTWFFFTSLPVWRVTEVQVINNSYIPVTRILEKAIISPKQSLWGVSNGMLRKRFKDDIWIKRITIHRKFPHTLIIDTTVRQPYFKLLIGTRTWFIDEEGKILNRDTVTPEGLPCYTVTGVQSITDIVDVLAKLVPLTKAFDKVLDKGTVRIDYANKNNIQVYTQQLQIKVGDATKYTDKCESLGYVLEALGDRLPRVRYIDVRAYQTPAVRFR